jgi:AraC-like DNA-binding protein
MPAGDDDGRVALSLFNGWLDDASHLLRDPGIGLRALAHLERGVGDVVELGASSAATLADALTFLARHVRILNEAADFALCVEADVARFELRSQVQVSRALRDFQMGAVVFALAKWLPEAPQVQVWFAYREPHDAALHRALFAPNRVHFDAPCDRIVLKTSTLAQPLRSQDAAMHGVLSRYAERLAREQSSADRLVRRVREVLLELLGSGKGDADQIAKHFGMSRRTLTRHLAREGINFRQLLEDVRHQSALGLLESTNIELSRIAELLGYTETSSFCRAFIRWRGLSPLGYRRACRSGRAQLHATPSQEAADN